MFNFSSPKQLREHCINHVLSPTESHGWHEVFEGRFSFLAQGDNNWNRCFELRKQWNDADQPNGPCSELANAYLLAGLSSHQRSEHTEWRGIGR